MYLSILHFTFHDLTYSMSVCCLLFLKPLELKANGRLLCFCPFPLYRPAIHPSIADVFSDCVSKACMIRVMFFPPPLSMKIRITRKGESVLPIRLSGLSNLDGSRNMFSDLLDLKHPRLHLMACSSASPRHIRKTPYVSLLSFFDLYKDLRGRIHVSCVFCLEIVC